MAASELKTVHVPQIASNRGGTTGAAQPVNIAYALGRWLRVLVRNLSQGSDVILAFSSQEGRQIPPSDAIFTLPAGTSEVFPLAPDQKMFASTSGADVSVSVCISDALPIDVGAPAK